MPVHLLNEHPDSDASVEKRCIQAAEYILDATGKNASHFNILLTTDEAVRDLNRTYRHIDKPTNVLSFPLEIAEAPFQEIIATSELGDIVISCDRAAVEAAEYSCPLQHRLNWLIVHGYLHLLGFDHETSEADAEEMYRREQELLSGLSIDNN